MSGNDQLAWEARARTRQTIVAALAGVLLVAAAIIQLSGTHTKVEELTLDLITEHKRFPTDLIGAIINSIALGLVAWTLSYLFQVARARNGELRDFIRWLAIIGGGLSAISAVIYAIVIASKANEFVKGCCQTYQQAHHLTSSGLVIALPLIAQFASLILTAGFVMIALNAMRVGLLTRFMGYLGVFAGVLVLFPIGSPVPVVQGFWLLALAYLLSGRWPSGLPASWRTGQIEKWPTSAEMRGQRGQLGRPNPKPKSKPKAEPEAEAEAEVIGASGGGRTRATTPKRKRKRRR
ncbi:MAG: hypothetical protein M3Z06_16095 [Actinomycetota bacterium]|nr:hypothetical protein [Actinomycetota bacterium]